jgi:SAM-dependent methyltransferase
MSTTLDPPEQSSRCGEGMAESGREVYVHGPAFDAQLTRRTAPREGAFLLPHLRAGMRVLDCGCGPGSITVGLATAVTPGQALGIDLDPRHVVAAHALAARQGVANVAFAVASVYDLPFPDASFDAAFANAVLFHLRDPLAALREMRRVLRRGGVIGIRDSEVGAEVLAPLTPPLARWQELWLRVLAHNGGSPLYARHQRRLLLEAGFARSEAQASVRGGGTPEATRDHAQHMRTRLEGPAGWDTAVAQGWVTRAEAEELQAEVLAWGERPDAFFALPLYSAVGWVSG